MCFSEALWQKSAKITYVLCQPSILAIFNCLRLSLGFSTERLLSKMSICDCSTPGVVSDIKMYNYFIYKISLLKLYCKGRFHLMIYPIQEHNCRLLSHRMEIGRHLQRTVQFNSKVWSEGCSGQWPNWVLNISNNSNSTTCLGNLFQCLTTLTVKKFLMFKWIFFFFFFGT